MSTPSLHIHSQGLGSATTRCRTLSTGTFPGGSGSQQRAAGTEMDWATLPPRDTAGIFLFCFKSPPGSVSEGRSHEPSPGTPGLGGCAEAGTQGMGTKIPRGQSSPACVPRPWKGAAFSCVLCHAPAWKSSVCLCCGAGMRTPHCCTEQGRSSPRPGRNELGREGGLCTADCVCLGSQAEMPQPREAELCPRPQTRSRSCHKPGGVKLNATSTHTSPSPCSPASPHTSGTPWGFGPPCRAGEAQGGDGVQSSALDIFYISGN